MYKYRNMRVLIVLILLLNTACVTTIDGNSYPGSFSPKAMFLKLPQGDDSYSIGFRDGCYNFIGQNGFGLQRMYDKPIREDVEMTDEMYFSGYRDGDRYCGVYVNKHIVL